MTRHEYDALLSFLFRFIQEEPLVAALVIFNLSLVTMALVQSIRAAISLRTYPTSVIAGSDGVLISWIGRHRHIPLFEISGTDIYKIPLNGYGVTLKTCIGERIKLPFARRFTSNFFNELSERIRRGQQMQAGGTDEVAPANLARPGAPADTWVQAPRRRKRRAVPRGRNAEARALGDSRESCGKPRGPRGRGSCAKRGRKGARRCHCRDHCRAAVARCARRIERGG
jgi:hypothetical protein